MLLPIPFPSASPPLRCFATMVFVMKTIDFIVCQRRITISIYPQQHISFAITFLWSITSCVVGVMVPEH